MGARAAKMALGQLKPRAVSYTGKLRTIWLPDAAASYLSASLKYSTLGNFVVEKRSFLSDRMGEKVASAAFTLTDDGQIASGLGTYAIDAEGLPQKATTIIDRGVLRNYLVNSYHANILGLESTGNCERDGDSNPDYEVSPSEGSKFLRVKPGSNSLEALLASIDGKAIMIEMSPIGIHHSRIATGNFSCVSDSAYLVEDGEVKYPLKAVSIGGNFYEGLANLRGLANDLTLTWYGVETPTFVTDGFTITG
jgi:PmbA protein